MCTINKLKIRLCEYISKCKTWSLTSLFSKLSKHPRMKMLLLTALLENRWLCLILSVAEQLNNCLASVLKYGSNIDWKVVGMFQENHIAGLTFRVWREATLEQLLSVPCLLVKALKSCFWVQALTCLCNCRIMLLRIISPNLFIICGCKAGSTIFFAFAGWPCLTSWNLWNWVQNESQIRKGNSSTAPKWNARLILILTYVFWNFYSRVK